MTKVEHLHPQILEAPFPQSHPWKIMANKFRKHSLRHRSAQDLCPEESALRSLNNLLIDRLWWVVHNHCAGLVIDLCVYTGVADEVDDPFLSFIL